MLERHMDGIAAGMLGEDVTIHTDANEKIAIRAVVLRRIDIGIASDLGRSAIRLVVSKSVAWTPAVQRDHVTTADGKRYVVSRIEHKDAGVWELICTP